MLVDEVVFVDDLVRFQAEARCRRGSPASGHDPAQAEGRRRRPTRRAEDLETITVTAPPDGQPKRVEIAHRPKRDRARSPSSSRSRPSRASSRPTTTGSSG